MDFTINEMQEMQKQLQEKYKDKWEPIGPETGKNKLLWMVGEIGEVVDIVKKNGGTKASTDPSLRKNLVEEMTEVLPYRGIKSGSDYNPPWESETHMEKELFI